eukprot:1180946-Amphidinium_carterae.1
MSVTFRPNNTAGLELFELRWKALSISHDNFLEVEGAASARAQGATGNSAEEEEPTANTAL